MRISACALTTLMLMLVAIYSMLGCLIAAGGSPENKTLVVNLLAVTSGGKGEVIKAVLWVKTPGHGRMLVANPRLVGADTVDSARLALYYASILSTISPDAVDAGLEILTSEEVSGLSAGAAFLTYYYMLLNSVVVNTSNVAITGVIAPNGYVAAVGGVLEKVKAAKEHGITKVIVPAGNYMNMPNYTLVAPVCSTKDLLLSIGFNPGTLNLETLLKRADTLDKLFKDVAIELIMLLNKSIVLYGRRVNASKAEKYLTQAASLYSRGRYYAAASIAYTGLIKLAKALAVNTTLLENFTTVVKGLANGAQLAQDLYKLKLIINNSGFVGLWCFEATASADYRLYAASKLLKRSGYEKALGALRLLSAKHWTEVAQRICRLHVLDDHYVPREDLVQAIKLLVQYARLSVKYFDDLVRAPNVKVRNPEELSLNELERDMELALLQGDYIRAYALAMNILGLISVEIVSYDVALSGDTNHALDCSLDQLVLHTLKAGIESLNALLMLDYAFSIKDNVTSIVMLNYASTYALLPLAVKSVVHVLARPSASLSNLIAAVLVVALIGSGGSVLIYLLLARKSSRVL